MPAVVALMLDHAQHLLDQQGMAPAQLGEPSLACRNVGVRRREKSLKLSEFALTSLLGTWHFPEARGRVLKRQSKAEQTTTTKRTAPKPTNFGWEYQPSLYFQDFHVFQLSPPNCPGLHVPVCREGMCVFFLSVGKERSPG